MTKDLLKKLEERTNNNVKLLPIFLEDANFLLLKEFLKKQNFLKPSKIISILQIKFLKKSPVGYGLFDTNFKIVGFLGTIFSNRKIAGSLIKHCYLHSWIVDSKYRVQAFRLLTPILENNYFISTYTPIKSLEGLYKKLNFEEKIYYSKLVMALPFKSSDQKKVNITDDQFLFENILSRDLKQLYEDHVPQKNKILFTYFNDDFKDHVLIFVRKRYKKNFIPILEILYVSDYSKFKSNEKNIIFELIKKFKTFLLLENYFDDKSVFSDKYIISKVNQKKAYYKNRPKKFDFNFLYSEILD